MEEIQNNQVTQNLAGPLPSSSKIAVNIQKLTKRYDTLTALGDFDLQIREGEIFGLLGPNGAGKSTLIGILTGTVNKTSGVATIFDKDVEKDYLFTRQNTGVVPQETISDGFFTVADIMEFQSGYYGLEANPQQIQTILTRLNLWEKRNNRVEQLSGGMKRRLLVAKALVHDPRFFILDEPTAGVDVFLRIHLWDYVREINERGTTILLTTHYLEEAENLCHRVGIMHQGKLLMIDTVPGILKQTGTNSLEEAFIQMTGGETHALFETGEDTL
jgi:ABC-2 type transport system ATP-binding protein